MDSKIFGVVLKSIQKILAKYPYVNINDKFIENFILEKVNKKPQDFDNQKQFINYVGKTFENTIRSIVKTSLDSETEYLKIIDRYLELARLEVENSDKNLNLLTSLSVFLNSYQFDSTPEKLVMIINNNHYLFNTTKCFIEKNIEQITSGNIRKIIQDDNVISFIEAYCMYHDIEIDKELDDSGDQKSEIDIADELYEFGNDSYYNADSEKFLEHEIRNYKILSFEEQKILFQQYQNGDEKAKEKLINTNLRLVLSIAKKHRNRGVELLDLFQVGTEGLITAVAKYDLNMNTKFSTYATWWIRQAITRTLGDHARTIRIPVYMVEAQNKLYAAEKNLTLELGREPTQEELARKLKISKNKLFQIYESQRPTVSLNVLVGDDGDTEMGDLLPNEEIPIEDSVNEKIKCQDVMNLLHRANLTDREIDVLIRRFGIVDAKVMSLEEVGNIYGVSRERIRQIEAKALIKLRKSPQTKAFASYMSNPDAALDYLEDYRKAHVSAARANKKNIDKADLTGNTIHKVNVKHTIYKYLGNYSKEIVDELIDNLSPASKELLRIRFGIDLENPVVSAEWNDEYHRRFGKLLHYMKKTLENPNHSWRGLKSIYKYFPKHDSFEVNLAIAMLNEEEQELLKLRYGDDLHYPTYNVDWEYDLNNDVQLQLILEKISKTLKLQQPPKNNRFAKDSLNLSINNIYDYFAEFTKENIDLAISFLPEDELSLLKIKFGEKLDEYYVRPKWESGQSSKCSVVLTKIKSQLKLSNFGYRYTVYELLSDYTQLDIDLAISKITDIEIKDKLNEFMKNGILTNKDKRQFNSIKRKIIKNISKIKTIGLEKTIYELYSEFDAKVVDYVLASLNNEDINLLVIKFGSDFHVSTIKRELSKIQQKKVEALLDKIQLLLDAASKKSNIEVIDIYGYFAEYSKNDVADAIARLSEEEINLLKLKFGDRLTLYSRKSGLTEEQNKKYKNLIVKIRRMITSPAKERRKKFFEVFADYEIQDVNNVLESLTDSERINLQEYYGKELGDYPVADKIVAKKVAIINAKIKRKLNNLKSDSISIYAYFNEYSKESIDLMLSKLNVYESFLLRKKFGNNLSHMIKRVNWSEEESKAYTALSSKMRRLLKTPSLRKCSSTFSKISIYDYFKEFSEDDIKAMILKLSDSELNILHKKFGNNLDSLVKRVNWDEGEQKQYIALSAKMRRILTKPVSARKENVPIEEGKISIYDYFKKFSEDDIKAMILKLSNTELNILHKKFGNNLDNLVKRVNWNEGEQKQYIALSAKMRRILTKPVSVPKKKALIEEEKISIYDYFKVYDKEEIDLMLSKLTDSEMAILRKKFGEELNSLVKRVNWVDNESKAYIALSSKMRRLLKDENLKIKQNIESVSVNVSPFQTLTREEINFMVARFTDLELVILHSKFGDDLDSLVKSLNWTEEESRMYIKLSKKIRSLLSNSTLDASETNSKQIETQKVSIYEYFNKNTVDEVNNMLSKLSTAELQILHKKFGCKLDCLVKRVTWTPDEHKAYIALYAKIQRILKSQKSTVKCANSKEPKDSVSIYKYFKDYTEEEVNAMLSGLTEAELKILYKKFGNNLDALVERVKWSDGEQKQYASLHMKMLRLLKKPVSLIRNKQKEEVKTQKITIYEYFKGYTKEEIDLMISKLTEIELKILYKKFGNNLDSLVKRVNWLESEQKQYASLHMKMLRLLKNPTSLVRNKQKEKVEAEQITIYEYFKAYSIEEINTMLANLTDNDLQILRKKFGQNLDCVVKSANWENGEKRRYESLLIKIKRRLESQRKRVRSVPKETKNLYEFFAKHSNEAINEAVASLTSAEREVLILYYGSDLTQKIDDNHRHRDDLKPILEKLKNCLKSQSDKPISLYEYLAPYSREDIDKVLSQLSYGEKYLLMLKFDADFSCYHRTVEWNEDERKKYVNLMYKIKDRLKRIPKPIVIAPEELVCLHDIFKGYSNEQIAWAVSLLSAQDREYIKSKYGQDLSNGYTKPDKYSYRLMGLLHKINEKLKTLPTSEQPQHVVENRKKDLLKKDHEEEVKNVVNNFAFHQILAKLPRVEAFILELKFGLYDKVYTTEEIAKLFNKSEIDIIRIIRCALEDAKVLINPVSDEIMKLFNSVNGDECKLILEKKE